MKISKDKLELFAKISGDFNPIHIDASYARKSFFRKQIVYGVYQVFLALECCLHSYKRKISIKSIAADFLEPIFVDEEFNIEEYRDDSHRIKVCIKVDSRIVTTITFSFGEPLDALINYSSIKHHHSIPCDSARERGEDKEPLYLIDKKFSNLFVECYAYLEHFKISVLLATTRIVGMKIPGLNSIYTSLSLNFSQIHNFKNDGYVRYTYKKHLLIGCYMVHLLEPFEGKIKAFIRPQPTGNETFAVLKNKYKEELKSNPFENQRALVLGGSQGIGNACAKLLALGGAKVLATYYSNRFDESHRNLSTLRVNISRLSNKAIDKIVSFNPTHMYYFATPKITSSSSGMHKANFMRFMDYYVFYLNDILKYVAPKVLFSSSSSSIEDLPLDMKEYSMAKAAMEIYGKYVAKMYNIEVIIPRFERLKTNQTLSLIPQQLELPSSAIMRELLKM